MMLQVKKNIVKQNSLNEYRGKVTDSFAKKIEDH